MYFYVIILSRFISLVFSSQIVVESLQADNLALACTMMNYSRDTVIYVYMYIPK